MLDFQVIFIKIDFQVITFVAKETPTSTSNMIDFTPVVVLTALGKLLSEW
jgi:hypothetical protein